MKYRVKQEVHYHPFIGGDHDGKTYRIRHVGELDSGEEVAWLEGKAGCVSAKALSPAGPSVCPGPQALKGEAAAKPVASDDQQDDLVGRASGVLERLLEDSETVISCLVKQAMGFWEECPGDFCVQHVDPNGIIFGGSNRVLWTPCSGFMADESRCTDQFLDHFREKQKPQIGG
jgi:hypothetical protein